MTNILDNEGRKLPIMEHFLSIQGEGYHTGLASYFIRIGGCDVGCHWCDVKESWNPDLHPAVFIDEVIEQIPTHIKTIVITGGEPALYNLDYLTRKLKQLGKQIHLETSGTGTYSGDFDWICLSPKKNEAPKNFFYQKANELKIIVFNQSDFKFALTEAQKVNSGCKLFLQPEWSKRNTILPEIIRFVIANPQWKISLQTHKYMNIP